MSSIATSYEAEKFESSNVSRRGFVAAVESTAVARQPVPRRCLSHEEEATLVAKILAGDETACSKLVALFRPKMMSVARRFMRCQDDCDDAVQDAFISAFNAIARFETKSRLSSWLHRITVNSCLMKLRRDASRKETSIRELNPLDSHGHRAHRHNGQHDPSNQAETDETRAVVRQAIDLLPDVHRTVIMLRYIEQRDTAATAVLLETSVHNVKRRLHYARRALCTSLEPMMRGRIPTE